ncbi:MAG: hypothetical protein GXP14_17445 [Gammaproteobacteria bacterium]|nr:hypothetical protein [Gammaproteobacteria bacterium]
MNSLTTLARVICICLLASLYSPGYAQFIPDFLPDNAGESQSTSVVQGNTLIGDQTPYLSEIVYDPATGLDYYHLLIGDPASGFAQDVYIERGFVSYSNGGVGAASAGGAIDGQDVFDPESGTARSNPNKVLVRQILNDGEISQEFLQTSLTSKPKLSQMVNAPGVNTVFVIDMSNSTYSDDTTAGTIMGSVILNDPSLDPGIGDFTMISDGVTTTTIAGGQAAEVQSSQITAGRYTYTDGSGPGQSDGTYNYLFDTYDIFAIEDVVFFDSSEDNPWSYTEFRPN